LDLFQNDLYQDMIYIKIWFISRFDLYQVLIYINNLFVSSFDWKYQKYNEYGLSTESNESKGSSSWIPDIVFPIEAIFFFFFKFNVLFLLLVTSGKKKFALAARLSDKNRNQNQKSKKAVKRTQELFSRHCFFYWSYFFFHLSC